MDLCWPPHATREYYLSPIVLHESFKDVECAHSSSVKPILYFSIHVALVLELVLEQAHYSVSSSGFRLLMSQSKARGKFSSYPGQKHCSPNGATQICVTSACGTNLSSPSLPRLPGWLGSVCPYECPLPSLCHPGAPPSLLLLPSPHLLQAPALDGLGQLKLTPSRGQWWCSEASICP